MEEQIDTEWDCRPQEQASKEESVPATASITDGLALDVLDEALLVEEGSDPEHMLRSMPELVAFLESRKNSWTSQ